MELVAVLPARDVVLDRAAAKVTRIVDLALRAVLIGPLLVGQNQRVLAVLVREEVENTLLLHQPRDKIEIGLAVLDAVFPLLVIAFDLRSQSR